MKQSAYARAGVDIHAGDDAVELMKAHVARASRPEVLGGIGGFAGLFDASALARYRHPVLATSTDGVGTKVALARDLGVYDTVGWDLVGMLVDDLVVCGAEPLFLTDYIACGKVVPERIASIVKGIADACAAARCALIGGETAEHPGLMGPDDFDMAGATTGVAEADELLGSDRVCEGDVAIAMASSGLHSNGYSLVRQVLLSDGKLSLDATPEGLARSLGEELLEPTHVYAAEIMTLLRQVTVHAMSHITGGGLANNLARVVPQGLQVRIERASWSPKPIFELVQAVGRLDQADIEETLNMGVGMIALVGPEQADAALRVLGAMGLDSWVCGHVDAAAPGAPAVELVGAHPAG
ncbi:phosphoribosylformylglycinamidine cyclo-ligase [Propionibacterium cyclohexanicum]|uniref:Phosphoribosylformylglycinamidine cyclo-ligase n=1 Tax=Propionibacterium cyclohexanicum TaxID=64702 RepID=A0A1H9T6R1_9ACTN|nr:phosphoribosylformylglycinamidine cyclo-ligase [Propionibacterium cyclohexanicum]SER92912.1 phosphoribosylformylglycinamidine cyclo-ligase [Propionibacterium cyclohexanicum]